MNELTGSDALLIFGLIFVGVAVALFFTGKKLHEYSIEHHYYSPYNKTDAILSGAMVACTLIGLYSVLIESSWVGYIFLALAVVFGVVTFVRIWANTNVWIAIAALLTYILAGILVVIAYVMYKVMTAKNKPNK